MGMNSGATVWAALQVARDMGRPTAGAEIDAAAIGNLVGVEPGTDVPSGLSTPCNTPTA